ncbi:hypothetical protein MTO96_017593 [Rhipicephalus appendiculatus]
MSVRNMQSLFVVVQQPCTWEKKAPSTWRCHQADQSGISAENKASAGDGRQLAIVAICTTIFLGFFAMALAVAVITFSGDSDADEITKAEESPAKSERDLGNAREDIYGSSDYADGTHDDVYYRSYYYDADDYVDYNDYADYNYNDYADYNYDNYNDNDDYVDNKADHYAHNYVYRDHCCGNHARYPDADNRRA